MAMSQDDKLDTIIVFLVVILLFMLTGCASLPKQTPGALASHTTAVSSYLADAPEAISPINEGCTPQSVLSSLRICPMLLGRHIYSVDSGEQYVWMTNYTGFPVRVTRVKTVTVPSGIWPEMSVYLDFLGTCEAPPDHCPGANLPDGRCPCMKDSDPGPKLRPVGAVGNMGEISPFNIPDLTWGVEGFTVEPMSYVVLGDNVHGSLGTMYEVTVEEGRGNDLVLRQPKVDHVIRCSGSEQPIPYEPWQLDTDATITGAQVYAITQGAPPQFPYAACVYIFDDPPDWQKPAWKLCNKELAATDGYTRSGSYLFTQEIKAGQWLVWGAKNKCPVGHVWDGVASLTLKRR